MDSIQGNVTQASIPVQLQFLQQFLPGFVKVMTAARKIDEIIGINTAGSWEDEEVVQGIIENTGTRRPLWRSDQRAAVELERKLGDPHRRPL